MSDVTNIINSAAFVPLIYLAMAMLIPLVAYKKKNLGYWMALLASGTALAISIKNVSLVMNRGAISYFMGGWKPPVGIEYVLDHLSVFLVLVINAIALLVLMHSHKIVKMELPGKEMPYYTMIMLLMCGFNGIVSTGDLFNLYVFLEISSLSLYGLIASGSKKAPVAAFRYLIMGTIAGSFYLLGVGFLYMVTGSLNMADVSKILPTMLDQPAVLVALVLMVMGMGIKMALFPVHGWLPDAYTYAPTTSSAIIAPTGTKVGAYVLLRVLVFVFGMKLVAHMLPVAQIICWLAAVGIIYGSVMAIAQKEMKRMLAYSSVAQIGYIALGIGMANKWALIGAVLHVLNHAFMKAGLFLVAGNMRYKLGHSNIDRMTNSIRKKMPWTMAAFVVGAMSMVGLPPMAGFFSKWYLALGTLNNGSWTGVVFLVVILISSLLNAVYFFRIIERVYMKPLKNREEFAKQEGEEEPERDEAEASMLVPTLVMAVGLIVLGLMNAFIVNGIIAHIVPAGW